MFLNISSLYKIIGQKHLFDNLSFNINEGEKIALIGRNGMGKTTLFKIINGEDKEYEGNIERRKNLKIILTRQEYVFDSRGGVYPPLQVIDYILDEVPLFRALEKKVKIDPETLGDDFDKIQEYTDAIGEFSDLGYYHIEDRILSTLEDFGINFESSLGPLSNLSGGQKRFVELTRIMYSNSDLALIDEPTNHMDYQGKEDFIDWMTDTKQSLFIISHDRDVLKHVDKILELKDKKIIVFNGNYDAYLKQNSLKTVTGITEYENNLRTLEKLHKQVENFKAKRSYGPAMRIMYERFQREYDELKEKLDKPSFWIDQNSQDLMADKIVDKYQKYKEKNILIKSNNSKSNSEHKRELLKVSKLSAGYSHPLFKNINFSLESGDRVFIKGRNGAGKSTLVKTIINSITIIDLPQLTLKREGEITSSGQTEDVTFPPDKWDQGGLPQIFEGEIKYASTIKLGIYEQEIDHIYLKYNLRDAVMDIYHSQRIDMNQQQANSILSQYLFDPQNDAILEINKLSGGQKARFQLIKMLSNSPNLLILDEPTNHLDLPSIEELENALINYQGAIIYISHDNYFIKKMEGEVVKI